VSRRGSIVSNFNISDLCNLSIPIIDNQEEVASFDNVIRKKIENNNKINTELEAMAKTIYDYWFLQFEFPNENGKLYKSSGGKMVWNDELKREIPEGWTTIGILDCCEIIDCLHSKKPTYNFEAEEYFLLTLENLTKDGNIDLGKKFYISEEDYKEWTSRITVKENDFVVTNAGRAGDICKIPYGVECAIGRNITAIRPNSISPYYLRQFFKSDYIKQQISANLDCGSFFMSFNVKSIKKIVILKPDEKIYDSFIGDIIPMIIKIENNIKENQELSSIRDFLLPMLMNGQVGFKE
jgi:type I restriction enzyme S subunit